MKKSIYYSFILVCFIFFSSLSTYAQDSPGMKHVLKAEALKKVRNYQGALLEYDNAIRLEPDNYEYWLRKGNIYVLMKDWTNAVTSLNKVVEIKPDYLKVYMILRKIHLKNRNIDAAIHVLNQAFTHDPDPKNKIRYKTEIIKLLHKTDNLKQAGAHLDEAKQLIGNNPMILFYDAKYSNLTGNHDNAVSSAQEALNQIMSDEPQKTAGLYYELGYAYHNLGKYKEANDALRNADYGPYKTLIFKLTPAYHFKLALAYYQTFRYDKCEELLDKSLQMQADFSAAHELKVKIADKKADQSLKIESLEASANAERDPNKKAKKLSILTLTYYESRNYTKALETAQKSLELVGNNYQLLFLRSAIYHKLSKNAEAIDVIKKLTHQGGLNQNVKAQYNFALGLLYEDIGNTKLAVGAFQRAKFGIFRYAAVEKLGGLTQ